MKEMNIQYQDEMIQEIKKIGKKKKVKKVIINVCDNYGGNDMLWRSILEMIIDKPIINRFKIVIKNSETNINYLGLKENEIEKIKIPFLHDNDYILCKSLQFDTLNPNKESINYSGKIYILQNREIYSSTGNLSATALYSDKLISIGESSGWKEGIGATPWFFMLPYSKIIFSMDTYIDITNVSSSKDFFNRVEIPLNLTSKDYRDKIYNIRRNSRHFLFKKDKLFIKALEL
jgi:hypothetical protein